MWEPEPVDLDAAPPAPRVRVRRGPRASWSRGRRRLGALVLVTLCLGGLQARALGRAPAAATSVTPSTAVPSTAVPSSAAVATPPPPAVVARPGVPTLPSTGARLLLLGSTATAYDVDGRRGQRLRVPGRVQALLDAVTLTGSDVVAVGSVRGPGVVGVAVALPHDGGHGRVLGPANTLVEGRTPGTVWLVRDELDGRRTGLVRLVGTDGVLLRGPYLVPARRHVVAEVADGLVTEVGAQGAAYRLQVWDPARARVVRELAADAVQDVTGGGRVVVAHAAGPLTVDGRARPDLPAAPEAMAVSDDGSRLALLSHGRLVLADLAEVAGGGTRTVGLSGTTAPVLAWSSTGWLFGVAADLLWALPPGASVPLTGPDRLADPPGVLLATPTLPADAALSSTADGDGRPGRAAALRPTG